MFASQNPNDVYITKLQEIDILTLSKSQVIVSQKHHVLVLVLKVVQLLILGLCCQFPKDNSKGQFFDSDFLYYRIQFENLCL
jgi:hypothetical protein